MDKKKRVCIVCNKNLVVIGNSRSNGKCHPDWSTRRCHKKCIKEYALMSYFDSNSLFKCDMEKMNTTISN